MLATDERYTYEVLHLDRWDIDIPVAREGNVHWFPARYMCLEVLRVNWSGQLEVLKKDSRFKTVIRDIEFNLGHGRREMVAIPRPQVALWILNIDPGRCGFAAQGTLDELQREIMLMSDRHIFQSENSVVPEEQRGLVSYTEHEEFVIACPDCGHLHRIVKVNGEIEVLRVTG